VFIKDIKYDGQGKKHWRYNLDDFTYYLPNNGYLVMLDSNYKNSSNGEHKIFCDELFPENNNGRSREEIEKEVFSAFKRAFDKSNFLREKMTPPDDDVLSFLETINNAANKPDASTDISDYIKEYFYMFVNNRVGTGLTSDEVPNVRNDKATKLKSGKLMARLVQNGKYEFVQFIKMIDGQHALIRTRNKNKDFIMNEIRTDELSNYEGSPKQSFKSSGPNLTTSGLLDTFNIK